MKSCLVCLALLAACSSDTSTATGGLSARNRVALDLRRIYEGSAAYYDATHHGLEGAIPLARQYPASTPATPEGACCDTPGKTCAVEDDFLRSSTWTAVGFFPTAPQVYRFEYISSGTEASARFEARASGDPDCTGQTETWHVSGLGTGVGQTHFDAPVELVPTR